MRIVKPYDWQRITTRQLNVVVEGLEGPDFVCVIWDKDAFAHLPARERPILASAPVVEVAPNVGLAHFDGLGAWRSCVLAITTDPQVEPLVASGMILARSDHTDWLDLPAATGASLPPRVVHPLRIVSDERSHLPASDPPGDAVTESRLESMWTASDTPVRSAVLEPLSIVDARPSLRLEDSVGRHLPKWVRLQFQSPYLSSRSSIARFRDAYASIPAGVVISAEAGLWSDSSATAFFNDPDLVHHHSLFRANGEVGMMIDETRVLQSPPALDTDGAGQVRRGAPLLLASAQFSNPAHWMLDCLYPAFLLRHQIQDRTLYPLVPVRSDYIMESLCSIGIDPCCVERATPGLHHLDDVVFPSTLSGHINFFPPSGLAAMFSHVRRWAEPWTPSDAPRRIYLTRLGSQTQRRMGNEVELIHRLRTRGFICVAPHELTFKEEVTIFSRAEIIVAQLGAALVNIGFAPPGCNVVEIASQNYTSNDFWFLSHQLGQRFTRILVDDGSQQDFSLVDFSFNVPLDETLASIDHIIAYP